MVLTVIIFFLSVFLNFIFKVVSPNFGAYRRGFDTVVFCTIATGYIGGVSDGIIFGVLIAISYYIMRSRQWDYALLVIPLAGVTGMLAGVFNATPLMTLGMFLLVFYHVISAIVVAVYKGIGVQYVVFVTINFITTFVLLRWVDAFLVWF